MEGEGINNEENQGEKSGGEDGHSEPKSKLVLVLIVLLGIAFLAWYIGFGGNSNEPPIADNTADTDTTQPAIEPDDVAGRDREILGLAIGVTNGKFFTHPETDMTLYVLKEGETCEGECLSEWKAYTAPNAVKEGEQIGAVTTASGEYQYTWNNRALYTFNGDNVLGDIQGNELNGVWELARP